jgi:hypothetical protein
MKFKAHHPYQNITLQHPNQLLPHLDLGTKNQVKLDGNMHIERHKKWLRYGD